MFGDKMMVKERKYYILLFVIILLGVVRISWTFATQKEGYHSDEPWSYGYANSFYSPYVYSDELNVKDTMDNIKNYNVWVPGKVFFDHIVVNKGEEFRFDSVVYNKKGDMSPPLFEILLHLVCSFFPETFSPYYALSINITCYIISLILIYLICKKVTESDLKSLIIAAFYAFSYGAFNITAFLRMYALLTLFTLLTVYLFQIIHENSRNKYWVAVMLVITVFLGTFSQFFYLLFAFFLTLFYCLIQLINKERKRSLFTGFVMLLGVCLFFLVYKSGVDMILHSGDMYEDTIRFPYKVCLDTALNFFATETFGVKWFLDRFFLAYVIGFLAFCAAVMGLLWFLFRNESWISLAVKKTLDMLKTIVCEIWLFVKNIFDSKNTIILCGLLTLLCVLPLIVKISNITIMGPFADRYFFYLTPVAIICVFVPIMQFLEFKSKINRIISIIVLVTMTVLLVRQNIYIQDSPYLCKKGENKTEISELITDKSVIVICHNASRMEYYSEMLLKCKEALFIDPENFEAAEDTLMNTKGRDEIYVIVENESERNVDDFIQRYTDKLTIVSECMNENYEINYLFNQLFYSGMHVVYKMNK